MNYLSLSQNDQPHTLGRWSTDRAKTAPNRVAVDDRGVTLSYAQLDQRATKLAISFIKAGYSNGDRIASLSGNSADVVVLFFACAKAGLVLCPLSWRLSPAELRTQILLCNPALLVIEDEFNALAQAALKELEKQPNITRAGVLGLELSIPEKASGSARKSRPVRDDDPVMLIFTTGTESTPKAAAITHANCFWNNLGFSKTVTLTHQDTVLQVLPQFHIGAWNIQPLLAWWIGATVVLERVFDPGRVLQLIQERKVTTMMAVPTQYLMLTEHPDFYKTDLSSLRHTIVGGAQMPESLMQLWHERGVLLTQGYGLTEASPNVLCLPYDEATRRIGWAGKPYPHVSVKLADPATGEELSGPASGELLVSGPGVFAGYFGDEKATSKVIQNGWLHTGDLAERDADGYYRIIGRLKEIYISGGENISPAEVEAVLMKHPGVLEVAVTGVPDERWGEVGAAWIKLRSDSVATASDLDQFCRVLLANYKVPKHFFFVQQLPKIGLGKVSKRTLRESFIAELSVEDTK